MSIQLRTRAAGDAPATTLVVARDADPRRLVVLGVDDRDLGAREQRTDKPVAETNLIDPAKS